MLVLMERIENNIYIYIYIYIYIDGALTNDKWYDMFQKVKLECLTSTSSEHYSLLLLSEVSDLE